MITLLININAFKILARDLCYKTAIFDNWDENTSKQLKTDQIFTKMTTFTWKKPPTALIHMKKNTDRTIEKLPKNHKKLSISDIRHTRIPFDRFQHIFFKNTTQSDDFEHNWEFRFNREPSSSTQTKGKPVKSI